MGTFSHLRFDRHRQKGAETAILALHLSTDLVGLGFRENLISCALQAGDLQNQPTPLSNQLILFDFLSDSSGGAQ